MRIKKGFTLAEILIVLMVIGVIATMTIPSLMKGVAEAQYKAGYKKAYNAIVNLAAMERISGQMPTKASAPQADNFFASMSNSLSVKEYYPYAKGAGPVDSGVVATAGEGVPAAIQGSSTFGLTSATGDQVAAKADAAADKNTNWIITDDGIAYTIFLGGATGDCGLKAEITAAADPAGAIAKACLVIVTDVNGLYKGPNRLEKQTTSASSTSDTNKPDMVASATTKMVTLTRDQYYIYIGSDGATAGPVGTSVSGRIVADLK